MSRPDHAFLDLEAEQVEGIADFGVSTIHMIVNDGDADIFFNFDRNTLATGTIRLRPEEVLTDVTRRCKRLHYRSTVGVQPFRAMGFP
jgi:hypothetical protein